MKRIRLKYRDKCGKCSVPLQEGTFGWWKKGLVRCTQCGPEHAADEATETEPPRGIKWTSLLEYLYRCVQYEAQGQITPSSKTALWAHPLVHEEDVICGTANEVPASKEMRVVHSRLKDGQEVVYGWPTLVQGRGRSQVVAGLLLTRLQPDTAAFVAAEDSPYLNPAVLSSTYFEFEALDELRRRYPKRLPFGSREDMKGEVRNIAEILGLDGSSIDPSSLETVPTLPNLVRSAKLRPGLHNAPIVAATNSGGVTRVLRKELRRLKMSTEWRSTAARFLVGQEPESDPHSVRSTATAGPVQLNEAQESAVESMRRDPVTVVTGPPGTGKSQVVAAAVANARLDGESVLLASTNNSAVEVAVERTRKMSPTLMLRTGKKSYREALTGEIAAARQRVTEEADAAWEGFPSASSLGDGLAELMAHKRIDLDEAARLRREVYDALETSIQHAKFIYVSLRKLESLTQEIWGATQRPLDLNYTPIGTAIAEELARRALSLAGNVLVLIGKRGATQATVDHPSSRQAVAALRLRISRLAKRLNERFLEWLALVPCKRIDAAYLFKKVEGLTEGEFIYQWKLSLLRRRLKAQAEVPLEKIRKWADLSRDVEEAKAALIRLEEMYPSFEKAVQSADDTWLGCSLEATRATCLHGSHEGLGHVEQRIGRARPAGPQLAKAIAQSLDVASGWATTTLSAGSSFPLRAGLFDLLIVDEASQCTLASVLPLLFRAKRVAIIGDPNQISPIVGLNESQAADIAASSGLAPSELQAAGMDHLQGSAYEAFAEIVGTRSVILLDQHYRCHPQIASWFNEVFYQGQLFISTDTSTMDNKDALVWIDVDGESERHTSGSSWNRAQRDQVVADLERHLATGLSVGIVTPFSQQKTAIVSAANARYGSSWLKERGVAVGTAHKFQGGERDIILFSTVVSPTTPPGTSRWIEEQRNLLNVAASRAKRLLVVYGHPRTSELSVKTLALLRDAARARALPARRPEAVHSAPEQRLLEALLSAQLNPKLKACDGGYELDFAIDSAPDVMLNIEVDGVHHQDSRGLQRRRDLARDAVLRSRGWSVARYPAWRCFEDPGSVVDEILRDYPALSVPAFTATSGAAAS